MDRIDERAPMYGAMTTADFAANTVTLEMHGDYYAAAGLFVLLREPAYKRLTELFEAADELDKALTEEYDDLPVSLRTPALRVAAALSALTPSNRSDGEGEL